MRRRTFGMAVMAAVITLSGCAHQDWNEAFGDGTPRQGGAVRLLSAVDGLDEAKTARFSIYMRIEGMGPEGAITVTGNGTIDFVTQRSAMTMKMLAGGETTIVEAMTVGGVAYVKTAGNGWMPVPVTSATAADPTSSDPTAFLTYLRGVADDVREVGPDTVRGDATVEYEATISLKRALERVATSDEERALLKKAIDMLGNIDMPVHVWIDEHDRVRRLTLEMDLAEAVKDLMKQAGIEDDGSFHPRMSVALELRDYGAQVTIKPPS